MFEIYFKSRFIFTDGFNSLCHFIFGVLSVYLYMIIPIFLIYQFRDMNDKNVFIDVLEFCFGYLTAIIFIYFHII